MLRIKDIGCFMICIIFHMKIYFNKINLDDNIISDKEQKLDDNIISNKRKLDDNIISDKEQNLDIDIFSNKNIKLFDENYRFTEIPLILPYISI